MFYETGTRASERIGSVLRDIACAFPSCLVNGPPKKGGEMLLLPHRRGCRRSYSNLMVFGASVSDCIGAYFFPSAGSFWSPMDRIRTEHWSPFSALWQALSRAESVAPFGADRDDFRSKVTNGLITELAKLDLPPGLFPADPDASNIHCQSGLLFFWPPSTGATVSPSLLARAEIDSFDCEVLLNMDSGITESERMRERLFTSFPKL